MLPRLPQKSAHLPQQYRSNSLIVLTLCALAVLPGHTAEYQDLALEQFVGNDQEVMGSTTTDESYDTDPSVFTVDINGDGIEEIFVSRYDLIRDGLWIMYHDELSDGDIHRHGIVEFDIRTARFGQRDGVPGYYETSHAGAGKSRITFNTIDESGQLVSTWEDFIEPEGKDKALYDEIYGSDEKFSWVTQPKPMDIQEIRAEIFKKKKKGEHIIRSRIDDPGTPQTSDTSQTSSLASASAEADDASKPIKIGIWIVVALTVLGGLGFFLKNRSAHGHP